MVDDLGTVEIVRILEQMLSVSCLVCGFTLIVALPVELAASDV